MEGTTRFRAGHAVVGVVVAAQGFSARTEARAFGARAIDDSVLTVMEAVRILAPEQRTRLVALWRAH